MVTTGTLWLMLVVSIVSGGVGLWIAYAVVKAAVLAALREHTMTSTSAVSITSSVPLLTSHVDQVSGTEHGSNG
ncbi:hypothetical protein [Glaciibacter psychrotolerans]|uniref:Cytoskeletal protein RodZ n=1 Tax=Glaciibacter psychrotolerans TaxID=670054 RepID=A0A7Z0EFQ3_9MICO|nr:hypothetical protein [Leifsonia psychrotolerans]NYJ20816.1 cytoskeletal protein RodZ [Leifsonia psychrotolerans]